MVQPGDIGMFTEAGLPNITGSFDVRKGASNANTNLAMTFKGPFYSSDSSTTAPTVVYSVTSVDAYTPQTINIDASRSSSIYGNSATVQPPAVGAKLYIQVFTSAVPASMAQAGAFINMLETKADKTELENYLLLTGGTMTGDILFKSGTGLRMKDASDLLIAHSSSGNADRTIILAGESYHNGASLYLYGSKHATNAGQFSIAANNGTDGKVFNGRPDGTLTWGNQSVLNPIGTVIAFAGNSAPSGYLICNGAAVSRTTYANLFTIIGTTYGEGDGSTTFNLPNLTNKFIMGSSTAGTSKAAGLPNINGTFVLRRGGSSGTTSLRMTSSGAFSADTTNTTTSNIIWNATTYSSAIVGTNFTFKASRSSSIYKDGVTTVQPPALTMRFYIKF